MCKVFMCAGIKPSKAKEVYEFMKVMGKEMTSGNTDGLGYAAITADGKLFGERWLKNDQAFMPPVESDKKLFSFLGDVLDKGTSGPNEETYSMFGEVDIPNMVAVTLHTRYATSGKGLQNVHPFVYKGVSLIHNGVIRNYDKFDLKVSTCDSEAILQSYINNKVLKDSNNINKMATELEGYYACGVLANLEKPILDVFRSGAQLHAAWVEELETYVISTTEMDIKDACRKLGYRMGYVFKYLDNKHLRIDAITGRSIVQQNFTVSKDGFQRSSGYGGHYGGPYSSPVAPSKAITVASKSTSADVMPFGKLRDQAKTAQQSPAIAAYINSGDLSCSKLSDRQIHEQIMQWENIAGGGMM